MVEMEEKYLQVTEKYMELLNEKISVMETKFEQNTQSSIEKLKTDLQKQIKVTADQNRLKTPILKQQKTRNEFPVLPTPHKQ